MNKPSADCALLPHEESSVADSATDAASVIAAFQAGHVAANAVISALRRSMLILPVTDTEEVMVGRASGSNWLYAFTSHLELARFASARNEGHQPWSFARVRGARLLDQLLLQLPGPCGVALDVAGTAPILLPPVSGRSEPR